MGVQGTYYNSQRSENQCVFAVKMSFFEVFSIIKYSKKNKKNYSPIYISIYISDIFLLFGNVFLLIEECEEFACAAMKNVLREESTEIFVFRYFRQISGEIKEIWPKMGVTY